MAAKAVSLAESLKVSFTIGKTHSALWENILQIVQEKNHPIC